MFLYVFKLFCIIVLSNNVSVSFSQCLHFIILQHLEAKMAAVIFYILQIVILDCIMCICNLYSKFMLPNMPMLINAIK